MKSAFPAACAALLLALLAGPASAHHSFAMFDRGRSDSIVGTVKTFDMINPHGWLQLMVMDAHGQPREWSLETGGAGQLARSGWQPQSVAAGEKITAVIHPLKDGSNGGQLVSVTLANGQTLVSGRGGGGGNRGGGRGFGPQ